MRDFLCCEKGDVFSMKELDKIMAESAKKGKEEQKVVDVALRTIDETFEKLVESSNEKDAKIYIVKYGKEILFS